MSFCFWLNTQAQEHNPNFCGFTKIQQELEKKHTYIKRHRERIKNILYYNLKNDTSYNGELYQIPVVVHIIENHSNNGKTGTTNGNQLSDEDIKNWIDNTNKMFAGTHPYLFPKGDDTNQSAVIPFKLVLAKRSPKCHSTTGIIRYNANKLPNAEDYHNHGMNFPFSNGKGVDENAILKLAPHWPEDTYYNIYLVTGIDNNFSTTGTMGYANYCDVPDAYYHAFMKASVVNIPNNITLAHEFGHSLGLKHTFEGVPFYSGKCAKEPNDEVQDTEISKSMFGIFNIPTNNQINPCTNKNYKGVQYNIMNYTLKPKKFTKGQRSRAVTMFSIYRKKLMNSNGAKPITNDLNLNIDPTPALCKVTKVKHPNLNTNNIGAIHIKFAKINHKSQGYNSIDNNRPYIDYTRKYCSNPDILTEIPLYSPTTLKLESHAFEKQDIKVWIDYNDNGNFETNEQVAYVKDADTYRYVLKTLYTFDITPPEDAITGKYLRMRIAGDKNNPNLQPCGTYQYGQAQDYLVKIRPEIKLKLNNITKTYDGNNRISLTPNNFTLIGKHNNDDIQVDLTQTSATYDNKNVGTNKTIKVTNLKLKGKDTTKYKLHNTNIVATVGTISKKTLKINYIGNFNKTYDATNSAPLTPEHLTLSGILNNDDVLLDVSLATATYDNKNAGTNKSITINAINLKGHDSTNYQLLTPTLSNIGTITKKQITITPNEVSKTYDDTDPTLTYTLSTPLLNGDTLIGNLTRTEGENVGTYEIHKGNLSASENYIINFISGKQFKINKATISDITLDDQTFIFDGKPKSLTTNGNLPNGVNLTYTNNKRTQSGTYNVTAELSGSNYEDLTLYANLIIKPNTLISGEINRAFTPNDDGINDSWYIKILEKHPDNKVQIYNNYGQLVFNMINYDNNQRTFKGYANVQSNNKLPQGTYFYKIILTQEVKQGILELRR